MSQTPAKATRTRNFERQYSDADGKAELMHDDATVATFGLSDIHDAMVKAAALRYLSDIVTAVGNATIKAGKTVDDAAAAMAETLAKLKAGTFVFRSGAGAGGLSLEEEKRIIAETIVALGQAPDVSVAASAIERLYAITKTNTKGQTMRPEYNKLKSVPQIKLALANAVKDDGGLSALLKMPEA